MWKEDMKHTKIYGKVFGIFEGKKPTLIVSDPEIVKQIMVKDFDHFNNHSVKTCYLSIHVSITMIRSTTEFRWPKNPHFQ